MPCDTGKIAYDSPQAAAHARGRSHARYGSNHAYRCTRCDKWHLGRDNPSHGKARKFLVTGHVEVSHYRLGELPIIVCVAEDAGTYGVGVRVHPAGRSNQELAEDEAEHNARQNLARAIERLGQRAAKVAAE